MITIVGATGHVGGKIADILTKKGEPVRLVARSSDRLRNLVVDHTTEFAGDARNTGFLVKAFRDADAVFTMIPPDPKAADFMMYANEIGESMARALEIAKVPYVVNLSSIGAELSAGTGPIKALHAMEERLNRIPGLNVLHVRAPYFMENLLWNIDLIRSQGITGGAIRGDLGMSMIATRDIAAYAADRLVRRDFSGTTVHDLAGPRDLTMNEVAQIIGNGIKRPGLPYLTFPYDEAEKGLVAMGLSPDMSRQYIEMSKAFNEGLIRTGSGARKILTLTTIEDFCDEVFVPAYGQKKAA